MMLPLILALLRLVFEQGYTLIGPFQDTPHPMEFTVIGCDGIGGSFDRRQDAELLRDRLTRAYRCGVAEGIVRATRFDLFDVNRDGRVDTQDLFDLLARLGETR